MSTARRILAGLLFLTIALSVLGFGHYYIALRLVLDPELGSPARELGLGLIALGLVSLFAQPIAERSIRPPWNRLVGWPASLWMGVAFLFLITLAAGDLLRFLAGNAAYAAGGSLPEPVASARAQASSDFALASESSATRSAFLSCRRIASRAALWNNTAK